ncbi:MAG: hypothetical protein FD180_1464 [Planctomycetota bacterium]|nr:MAG: hypothetical protein FD180_1464 [Planctomycetota bacterium]
MDGSVYPNKDFVGSSKKWVSIYCNKETTHGTKKVGDKEMCSIIPSITCEEHVQAYQELNGKFFKGSILMPHHIWGDVEGNEIGREKGAMATKLLTDKMAEAAKKVGPGLGADEYTFMGDQIAAGDKAASDGKIAEAIKAYNTVVKQEKAPGAKTMAGRAQDGLNRLNESGKALLEQATEAAAASDFPRAKEGLKKVIAQYKGLPVCKQAEQAMADIVEKEKNRVK